MRAPILALSLLVLAAPIAAQRRPASAPATPATQGPPALALNTPTNGTLGSRGESAKYSVNVTSAGLLTVAASAGTDIAFTFTDEDGQTLRDGTVDRDYGGNTGAEYGTIVLPRAGKYLVEIRGVNENSTASFTITAAFVAVAFLERPDDADGRPSGAKAVQPGAALDDSVDPDAGDAADWYTFTAETAMTLVIVTRVEDESGDLVIDAYSAGNMSEAVGHSDQDLRGNAGNESVTIDVRAGETIKFKVFALSESGGTIRYRLSLGMVP